MSLLRVTHEGSVCLQEKVQISSIIRHLSTSSGPLSLISLCPTGLCTAPKYAFFPPVFRALLLPLPLSGTPCLPSSVKSYLLPSLESPALAGSPPRSHWSGRNFLCLPTAPPCFPTVVLPIFPHPSVHITVGACRSWAHGSGLMVFFLACPWLRKTAQALPTSSWPGGEVLPWSQPWVPATYRLWFNLSKPWFPHL